MGEEHVRRINRQQRGGRGSGGGSRLGAGQAGPEPDSRLGAAENRMNSEAISETD